MTAEPPAAIRPLTTADAPACDDVIRSLPYHFGDPDGRRECAEAVQTSPGLVATRDDRVVGFLTITHHFPATSEIGWMAVPPTIAGRASARELPNLWPNHPALLLAMPLEVLHDEVRR
jgi:hypothetical protein